MKKIKLNIFNRIVLILLLTTTYQPAGWSQVQLKKKTISPKRFDSLLISKNYEKLKKIDSVIVTTPPVEPPQANAMVHLKKNIDLIHEGEPVIFKAELSKPDKEAVYIFTINYKELLASGRDVSEVEYMFPEPGIFNIHVLVRTRNQILHDSLIVEVNSPPEVDTPQVIPDYSVTLRIHNPQSTVGETVTFEALSAINKDGLEYWFNFGDDNEKYKSTQPLIKHIYEKPDYYTASVKLAINNKPLPAFSSALVIVEKPFEPYVTLSIIPTAYTGDKISLIASTNVEGSLEYEFYLGGNFEPIRTGENTIQFMYSDAGTYIIFVKLFQMSKEIAISKEHEIVIKMSPISPPEPDWWIYLVSGLVIIAAGYTIRKWLKKPGGITFHPHPDNDLSNMKEPKKFIINYEVHFNPNLANANYLLKSKEENFIKSKTVKS